MRARLFVKSKAALNRAALCCASYANQACGSSRFRVAPERANVLVVTLEPPDSTEIGPQNPSDLLRAIWLGGAPTTAIESQHSHLMRRMQTAAARAVDEAWCRLMAGRDAGLEIEFEPSLDFTSPPPIATNRADRSCNACVAIEIALARANWAPKASQWRLALDHSSPIDGRQLGGELRAVGLQRPRRRLFSQATRQA
jgi:hypothetical protein